MWATIKEWWLENGECKELKNLLCDVSERKPTNEIIKKFSKDDKLWALFDKLREVSDANN